MNSESVESVWTVAVLGGAFVAATLPLPEGAREARGARRTLLRSNAMRQSRDLQSRHGRALGQQAQRAAARRWA